MTDKELAVAPSPNGYRRGFGRLEPYGSYDDSAIDGDWPADTSTGLVSLAFLKAAIRRSARFCIVMTVVGFLVGCGIYIEVPSPYQATTSLLLTYGPYENADNTAPTDDAAIAHTSTVAALAVRKLGSQQSIDSFLSEYTVTVVSNRVLLLTFTARSASQALHGASAVATAFLQFRAEQLDKNETQVLAALQRQVSLAGQNVSSIKARISQLATSSLSAAQPPRLKDLQAELKSANATLGNLQQAVNGNKVTDQPATAVAVKDSQLLDAAALLPRSHLRHLLLYPGAGLVGGLALAIAIVLIRSIVSDRLRRRDDIATALGAPVKLSTGPVRTGRRLPGWRGRGAGRKREADIRRIAAYLSSALPDNNWAALAVVAVDDAGAAALPLMSLATSRAQRGQRVLLADLAIGAPAARLLGASGDPGVSVVSVQDAPLAVAVPEREDVAPSGPLGRAPVGEHASAFAGAVAAARGQADLLLTLVTLDPSVGSEHLATWADTAVVVVTAGRSSWTKINAVGEMMRLSGMGSVSAVLIGADSADESLGVITGQQTSYDASGA